MQPGWQIPVAKYCPVVLNANALMPRKRYTTVTSVSGSHNTKSMPNEAAIWPALDQAIMFKSEI